jgi:hypothetical protein
MTIVKTIKILTKNQIIPSKNTLVVILLLTFKKPFLDTMYKNTLI